jgi:hypothetical protein
MSSIGFWAILLLLAHLPYAREVIFQLVSQAKLFDSLPIHQRAQFPNAPSHGKMLPLASRKFWMAFRAYIDQDDPLESNEVCSLKRALRESSRREKRAAIFGFVTLLIVGFCYWGVHSQGP